MDKYTTRSTTEVITQSKTVINDGFSGIYVKNIGADICNVLDNIPLEPGENFSWTNEPNVKISDNLQISFAGVEADKRLVLMKIYFDKSL